MEVYIIHPVVAAHSSHLLAALHELVQLHIPLVQMSVERVHHVDLARGIAEGMADDHHIAPAHAYVLGQNHHTAPDGVNRIAQVAVTTAAPVPVLPKMTIGIVATRLVIAGPVGLADRKIKAVGQRAADVICGVRHGQPHRDDQQEAAKGAPLRSWARWTGISHESRTRHGKRGGMVCDSESFATAKRHGKRGTRSRPA